MSKVLIHVTMSLDGYIARPDDALATWAFQYQPDDMIDKIMQEIGVVVLGYRTYQVSLEHNQLPYGGRLKVPQFVVTHTPRDPVTTGGLTFSFVAEGVKKAIQLAQKEAGSKSVALLGANLDQQALQLGLVDEIAIHIAPVLLGQGIRLFGSFVGGDIKLERTGVEATSDITSLRFRILK